jgi:predicted NBD/HSP70 family sugar kinase
MPKIALQPSHAAPDKLEQGELSILELVHSGSGYSRLDLARKTGLSPSSITAIVRRLMHAGLVTEAPSGASAVGRKPIPLEIRGDIGYFVGIDIGSFYLRTVVTNINGRIAYKHQIETGLQDGRERVLRRAFECVNQAIAGAGVPRRSVLGIGIGHSGVIDPGNGLVISYPRPGQMAEWKNVPLRDLFQDEFKVPCLLEDSARTMATAEQCFGLGRNVGDFLYIEVGVGIGAAFFLDGKLYRGGAGSAGEFGHITVKDDGPICSCGNIGCLESVASCAAIIEAARNALEHGVDSKIQDLANGNLERISIEIIAQAAAANDSLAFRVLQEGATYIAHGLADLVNLLNPRLIVFGGALFRAAPQLLSDPLRRIVKQRSLEKSANEVHLKVSPLGEEAGALGASRMIAGRALEDIYLQCRVPVGPVQ